MNLLGASLRLGGEEFLALPGGVGAYRRIRTTGLPLLAPWANRLSGRGYRAGRVRVDLDGLNLYTDPNGLPIHGTMSAQETWHVSSVSTVGRVARLRAGFEYAGEELLAAFPFPHRLETSIDVDGRSLSVATTIRPSGGRAVPISFGYHPYFRLPGGRRSAWRLLLPRRRHVELDERGIPTGRSTPAPAEAEPIGARTYDDLFELTGERRLGIQHGGRRLSVLFGSGFPYAQVYAPPGAGFACLEPMTAPTNALVAGNYPIVRPGQSFTARFSIRPETIRPGTA
ncbi:MAG TPA: aldose 1-epimerase [Actinomycetota bacterium]|jgi:galactose mutarotase-like enzyme|nr:aldose 1-epimerase [Actinomycetota bacterium]